MARRTWRPPSSRAAVPPPLPLPERAGRQRGGPPCRPLSLRRPSSLHLLSRRPWHRRLRGRGRHAVWTEQTGGRGRRAGSPPRRRPCFGWSSSRRGPALLLLQLITAATAPLLPSPSGRDGASSSRGGGGGGPRRGDLRAARRADQARARSYGTGGFPVELPPLASRGSRGGVASRGGRGGAASGADAARRPRRGGAAAAGRTRQGRGKHGGERHGAAGRKGERERADGWARFLQGQRRLFMWCGVLETKIKEWSVLCTISKSGVCLVQIHSLAVSHTQISLKKNSCLPITI